MSAPAGTGFVLPSLDFDTGGGFDLHPAIGLIFAAAGGHKLVSSVDPLPVTAAGSVTDMDDNSVVAGQTLPLGIVENYIFDGTNWVRLQGGIDNAAAPASPQGAFVAGEAHTALQVYADGDIVIPNFDTSGRLRTTALTTPSVTDE